MDRLTSMAVFMKAADLGSFKAAGDAMGLSSQMVGKHVFVLEQRLGAQLLHRTTRKQSLTAIGRVFYERCQIILAEIHAAETLVDDLSTTPRGTLRVNAPVTFGACVLAPLVRRYLSDYPDVQVELTLTDRFVDVVEEGYDVVIRLGPLTESGLAARRLRPLHLLACASPAYLREHGEPSTPSDLADHACLGFVYSSGFPFGDWHFAKDGVDHAVAVRSRFQVNDSRVLLDAARAGFGIVLQGDILVQDDLDRGRLVRILPDYAPPEREIALLFSNARRTPKLRTFIDRVVERFG